jgi:prevent-host-death family protein
MRGIIRFRVFGYPCTMTEITVSDARARLADALDMARVAHEPVYLTRRGKRVGAIIGTDDLAKLTETARSASDAGGAEVKLAAQRDAIDGLARFTGMYPQGYLEALRDEWPA